MNPKYVAATVKSDCSCYCFIINGSFMAIHGHSRSVADEKKHIIHVIHESFMLLLKNLKIAHF